MRAYYNEFEPYAAQWLRNLIGAGHLPPGDVDERDIKRTNRVRLGCNSSGPARHGMLGKEPIPYLATSNSGQTGGVHFVRAPACVPNPERGFLRRLGKPSVLLDYGGGIVSGLSLAATFLSFCADRRFHAQDFSYGIHELPVPVVSGGIHPSKCVADWHQDWRRTALRILGKFVVYRYPSMCSSIGKLLHIFENKIGLTCDGIHNARRNCHIDGMPYVCP